MCGCSIHNWHSLSDSSKWLGQLNGTPYCGSTFCIHMLCRYRADTHCHLPAQNKCAYASVWGLLYLVWNRGKRVHLWDECQIVEQPHGSPISTCHRQLNTALAEQTQLHISMRRSLPRSTLAPCVVEHDQSCTKGVHIAQRHWIGSIQYMFRRFPLHTMNANIRY